MTYYTYPPSSSGGGVPIYATFGAFPPGTTPGQLAVAADTGILYEWNGSAWVAIASPGAALSVGTFDSGVPSPNGAHIDSNALIMQSASTTNPGEVNISTQTFAGNKTFTGMISAANLTGQNSGDASVVFRPGGVQGGVVYDNWPDLYAAIVTLDIAAVDVCFDDSISPILIPSGSYNLINVTFQAAVGRGATTPLVVTLDNGCVFTNFPAVKDLIQLVSQSASSVFTVPLSPTEYTVVLQFSGKLLSVSGAPLITVPGGSTLDLLLSQKSTVEGVAGFPVIALQTGASLTVILGIDSVFSKDTVSGDATTTILIVVTSASGTFNQSQADFSGSFFVQYEATITNLRTGVGLGDMVYSNSNSQGTILTANTSTNKMFLSETGTGSLGNAPVWSSISSTDMPAFTGDVTTTAGSTVTTVAKIQAKPVSGTTGTINVVFSNSPTLVTPILGAASATSLSLSGQLTSTVSTGTAPFVVASTTQVANLNVATAGNFTGSLVGDVTGTQGATVLSATTNGTLTSLTALTTAASLVTVGTITTGTWSATTIAVNKGGTGLTSGTSGGILGFTGTTTLASSALLTTDQLVVGGGAGATPKILAAGTTGQYLRQNATPIPAWYSVPTPTVQTFTNPIYSFTITSATATAGSTYTNNSQTFQLIKSITSATTALLISITGGAPGASGTLTSAETGVANLTFSAQSLSSGATSGTYTPTSGTVWFRARLVGGGGGGGGGGTAGTAGNGGSGGTTSLTGNTGTTVLTGGGASGGLTNNGNSQFGGIATIVSGSGTATVGGSASPNIGGFSGTSGGAGSGASTIFGGRGGGAFASSSGTAAIGSSGSGGGGGGASNSSALWGPGGAGGGYVEAVVTSVVASYAYLIGAGGTAGTAGTNGSTGGAGGSGYIEITEFYI